jgi:HEAT repeat protein
VSPVRRPTAAELGARPADRLAALVALVGADAVVDWCVALLRGGSWTDPGAPDLDWIGGRSSASLVDRALALDYWPRVWAARGLLHVYRPQAAPAVVAGLDDESWRVREMCAKVVRAQEVGAAAEALHRRTADDVPRVRVAAVRGLARVGEAEDADVVRDCLDDPEPSVVAAAGRALRELSRRLDRDV